MEAPHAPTSTAQVISIETTKITMADDEDKLVTKPFKFVTGKYLWPVAMVFHSKLTSLTAGIFLPFAHPSYCTGNIRPWRHQIMALLRES